MKTFLLFLLLLSTLAATETFSGSGAGARVDAPGGERQYTTPWITTLRDEIVASPRLTTIDQANTVALLVQLAEIAAQPSSSGLHHRAVGQSRGSIQIDLIPDYLVSPGYRTGSAFSVFVSLEAPTAPPVNRPPTVVLTSPAAQTIVIGGSLVISSRASDPDANLIAHHLDLQRPDGEWNFQGNFATGEPFIGGPLGSAGESNRTASFVFDQVGTYTVRAAASDGSGWVHSESVTIQVTPPANRAPTLVWASAPSSVAHQASFLISARAQDADGNLAQVNVWLDGAPFAFAAGGTGFSGESGNPHHANGPATLTFTAQAVDADGASSPVIRHTVTVAAPPVVTVNEPPTVAWTSTPGTVESGQPFTVAARGTDPEAALAAVTLGRDGVEVGTTAATRGTPATISRTYTEVGPLTLIFTAQSFDTDGLPSEVISQVVSVRAPTAVPANQPPTVELHAPETQTVVQGTSLRLESSATDPEGTLVRHDLEIERPAGDWNRDGAFAAGEPYRGGPVGSPAVSSRSAPFTFTDLGVYHIRASAYDGTLGALSRTVTITVVAPSGTHRPPLTIVWTSTPGTVDSDQPFTVSAQGTDPDRALIEVKLWRDGALWDSTASSGGDPATVGRTSTESGPRTIVFTAQAFAAEGRVSETISQTVTVRGPSTSPQNRPPTVVLLSPSTQTVAPGTELALQSHATDPDGNLTRHDLELQRPAGDWNFQGQFAAGEPYRGGPVGTGTDSTRSASFTFADLGTYTVRAAANDGSGWVVSHSVTITVATSASTNQAPTVEWTAAPTRVDSGETYSVRASGRDDDGNLVDVRIWRSGVIVATGSSADGRVAEAGQTAVEAGPQTITYTAQARDAAGAPSPVLSLTVVVDGTSGGTARLTTAADPGGTVSPGGVFPVGATAVIAAAPDGAHDFAGWIGDATGILTPQSLVMDRDKTVTAQFTHKTYVLTTSATPGGTVSPGGLYPHGTVVTVEAIPSTDHRFSGWTGHASGAAPTVAVLMDGPKTVQANFSGKQAQAIIFPAIGDQPVGAGPIILRATASSGLPVSYAILSGPATVDGDQLQVTGPGTVTVQASQNGDAFYLPAVPVNRSLNVLGAAEVKYRSPPRTLFRNSKTRDAIPYVIGQP